MKSISETIFWSLWFVGCLFIGRGLRNIYEHFNPTPQRKDYPCGIVVNVTCKHGEKYSRSLYGTNDTGCAGGSCGCAMAISYRLMPELTEDKQ